LRRTVVSNVNEEALKSEKVYYEEDVIDLREYLAVIYKWRWVIAMLTLCAVLTAGVLSFFVLPPVYETKTVLMVAQAASTTERRPTTGQESLESVVSTISSIPQLTMNTYVAQVKNYTVLANTLAALGEKGEGLTVNSLMSMIEAQALKDTNLLEIKVSHTDPVMAAEIANTLRAQYLDFISASNQEKMKKSVEFLQNQLAIENKNLENVGTEIQRLEAEPRNFAFLQKEIEGKYADLSKYQSLANQALYEYQQLQAGRDRLKEQLAQVSPTITVNRAEGKEELNPAYVSLNDALIRKETELAEKAAQLEAARQIVAALQTEIKNLQAEAAEKKLAMDRLNSDLERTKKTYDLLNEKMTQTQMLQAVNLGETYLIPVSPAPVPSSPVRPKKGLNMAIAGVLGLMAAVMLSFLLEFLDNTVKDSADVQKLFNLPVIGTIPVMEEGKARKGRRQKKTELREENLAWTKAST